MKRLMIILLIGMFPYLCEAAPLPDNVYFRAMNDEMQRSLNELHLKDHPDPYYIAYWLSHRYTWKFVADMGTLTPSVYDPADSGYMTVKVAVSVGSDKQDGLGFSIIPTFFDLPDLPEELSIISYDSIRQTLWHLTNANYVRAVNIYKKKKSYKQKKNISDSLPDVIAATPAYFVEEIKPVVMPPVEQLQESVKKWSALGKTLPFIESFSWSILLQHTDIYYLNSRGAVNQHSEPIIWVYGNVSFRQTDGKMASTFVQWGLKDTSVEELNRTEKRVQDLLERIKRAYGAPSGESYVGPVLLKPTAAAQFVWNAVLADITQSKPWLWADSEDDPEAGQLYKKQRVRVSSDLATFYDRPGVHEFQGVALSRFSPVDDEGIAAKELTLIENGRVKEFPLSQRPLSQSHQSNGHGCWNSIYGPRECLTNVFVEPKESWSDEQMEEKLVARCRELGLEYGYILNDADPSGDLGIERIYTADGHKETVLNLKWDGNFFTQRDLRSILAVGGESKIGKNVGEVIITPSFLLSEVELVPKEHQPHRLPFISKPK